jgi:bromodomain adjacent to zinc finger domain protein 1A
LNISVEDSLQQDSPDGYYYWCYLLELEKDKSHEKGKNKLPDMHKEGKLVGSLVEVRCQMMRSVFSLLAHSVDPHLLRYH